MNEDLVHRTPADASAPNGHPGALESRIKDHPISEIFPLMRALEFEELVHDIKENGLREPIVLLDGMILDGRNRYRACSKAGVKCEAKNYDGKDALKFVISKNLIRRHLKEAQRGFIAAELANMSHGGNRRTKEAGNFSISEAAQLLNVSESTIARCIRIKKSAVPELCENVQKGDVSALAADQIAKLTPVEQRQIIARGKRAIVSQSRKSRGLRGRQGRTEFSIFWKCVDEICDALEQSRIDQAHLAATNLVKELARVAQSRRKLA